MAIYENYIHKHSVEGVPCTEFVIMQLLDKSWIVFDQKLQKPSKFFSSFMQARNFLLKQFDFI